MRVEREAFAKEHCAFNRPLGVKDRLRFRVIIRFQSVLRAILRFFIVRRVSGQQFIRNTPNRPDIAFLLHIFGRKFQNNLRRFVQIRYVFLIFRVAGLRATALVILLALSKLPILVKQNFLKGLALLWTDVVTDFDHSVLIR